MERNSFMEKLSSLIGNSSLNISLEGWPAAVAIIALCFAGVAIFAIKMQAPAASQIHF